MNLNIIVFKTILLTLLINNVFCQNIENSRAKATQFTVEHKLFNASCGKNNGIIRIRTDAQQPTFSWNRNAQSIDSIAYNLAPNDYVVTIKDVNNNTQYLGLSIINRSSGCIAPSTPVFTYAVQSEGILRLNSFIPSNENISWNMGDGKIYTSVYDNFYHKYQTAGTYNVCLTLTNEIGSSTSCQTVNIPAWTNTIEGQSYKTTGTSLNGILVKNICECGGNSFVIGNTSNISTLKLYKFDTNNDEVTLLPIDAIGYYDYNFPTVCYNNKLFFPGKVGTSGIELCESDGTAGGTKVTHNYVSTANLGINPANFQVYNGILYFDGNEEDGSGSTKFPFRYSGGTVNKITELGVYGFGGSRIFNNQIIHSSARFAMYNGSVVTYLLPQYNFGQMYDEINGIMVFVKEDFNSNNELWRTDGTANGTYIIKEIRPGNSWTIENYNYIKHNNKIYFVANDGITGNELWVTDGTASGTYLVKDIHPGDSQYNISDFAIFNNKVYFVAIEGTTNGWFDLWETDGTNAGTKKALGVSPNIGVYHDLLRNDLLVDNDVMYFSSYDRQAQKYNFSYLTLSGTVKHFPFECADDLVNLKFYRKMNNGKVYINFSKNLSYLTYATCQYNLPNIEDRISTHSNQISLNAPTNSSVKWYSLSNVCTPISTSSSYTFNSTQNFSIYARLTDNSGCVASLKKVQVYNQGSPSVFITNIARCDASTIRIKTQKSGFFKPENEFKIFISSTNPSFFNEISTVNIGDELIGYLPPELNNTNNLFAYVRSTAPNILFYSSATAVPNIYDSNSAYILGNNTISQGGNADISILMLGNPPYSFDFNGQNYAGITKNPYFINVAPTVNTSYLLSNFQNSCGSGNVIVNTANVNISQCYNQINQSGILNSGVFKASNSIESIGILNSPKNLSYESSKIILLNPGFGVNSGAVFKAEIKNCQ